VAGDFKKWSKAVAKGRAIGVANQFHADRRASGGQSGARSPHDGRDESINPDGQTSSEAADDFAEGEHQLQPDLKKLAKDQMGKVERIGAGPSLRSIGRLLAEDERVDLVFGCQIDGKQAAVALTDRRLLAAYGMLSRSDTIDYQSIGQVNTGLTKVEIKGAGVSLTAKGGRS
jgi:hypothetical protein